jgi:hypothetical protein
VSRAGAPTFSVPLTQVRAPNLSYAPFVLFVDYNCCSKKESSLAWKQLLSHGRCPVTEIEPAAESGLFCPAYNFSAVYALWSQNPLSNLIPPFKSMLNACEDTRDWVETTMRTKDFQCKDL